VPEQPSASQPDSKPTVIAIAAAASTATTTTITETAKDESTPIPPTSLKEVSKPNLVTEKPKEIPNSAPELPLVSQQDSKPLIVAAAAASITNTKTTTTTKTTNGEPAASAEKPMANISQESLDELHLSMFLSHDHPAWHTTNLSIEIDSLHLAIKQITETLALHLPPPTPTTLSNPKVVEPVTSESEPVSVPGETAAVIAAEPSHAPATETAPEPAPSPTEDTKPKRQSPEKRTSVMGSIGKILWPFGSSSPTKNVVDGVEVPAADPSAPKVPTVTVTEVPTTPEIRI
jgi:hypothetical protein